ncbi:hypothetical protein BDN70DRAFT_899963 [Pholiota conissans]|uniref:Uncharacterized protein n=1 Tax=Pholiota conissans TaxID=109636 RepID=A0A9P5YPU5_9AGAR|nr:hypothetical protein BDN70DRAFT_899963 [Pholiota conissans]
MCSCFTTHVRGDRLRIGICQRYRSKVSGVRCCYVVLNAWVPRHRVAAEAVAQGTAVEGNEKADGTCGTCGCSPEMIGSRPPGGAGHAQRHLHKDIERDKATPSKIDEPAIQKSYFIPRKNRVCDKARHGSPLLVMASETVNGTYEGVRAKFSNKPATKKRIVIFNQFMHDDSGEAMRRRIQAKAEDKGAPWGIPTFLQAQFDGQIIPGYILEKINFGTRRVVLNLANRDAGNDSGRRDLMLITKELFKMVGKLPSRYVPVYPTQPPVKISQEDDFYYFPEIRISESNPYLKIVEEESSKNSPKAFQHEEAQEINHTRGHRKVEIFRFLSASPLPDASHRPSKMARFENKETNDIEEGFSRVVEGLEKLAIEAREDRQVFLNVMTELLRELRQSWKRRHRGCFRGMRSWPNGRPSLQRAFETVGCVIWSGARRWYLRSSTGLNNEGWLRHGVYWVSAKRLNHPFLGAGYRDDTDGSERLKSFTPHVLTMDVPEVELNV